MIMSQNFTVFHNEFFKYTWDESKIGTLFLQRTNLLAKTLIFCRFVGFKIIFQYKMLLIERKYYV